MKKTYAEACEFIWQRLHVDNAIYGGKATRLNSEFSLEVRRGPAHGSLSVRFRYIKEGDAIKVKPEVLVCMPGFNAGVARAGAYAAVLNELLPFALSLQAELDEFDVATP